MASLSYQSSSTTSNRLFYYHGIWPERLNGTWPQYCNNSQPFNASAIADLKPILQYIWYDYRNKDPDVFWKHEWDKHGTCSEDIFPTERDYFLGAINMHKKYRVLDALINNGIKPGDTPYSRSIMEGVLQMKYGKKARLMCERDKLKSVEICIDKRLNVRDCVRDSECPEWIQR